MFRKREKFNVYLFRHGQTTFNRDERFTGWMDSKLTKNGRKNALNIARQLKDKKIDVAIHTRLSRTKDTLATVLKYHPECTVILEDNRMIERSYGNLEGEKHKNFIRKIGKREYDLRVHGDAIVSLNKGNRKDIEEFFGKEDYDIIHRGWDVAPPAGESFADVEVRVKCFIKDLKKFVRKNKVNVMISAHGNSIRLFRKIMEKARRENVVRWVIPYNKVYKYVI